jgi:hypothetical protein
VHIECEKAAVVIGNENTKSVLITKVDRASGEIDATQSTTLDQYKQLINFKFQHPVVQMKPNDDYKEDQTAAASRIKRGEAEQSDSKDIMFTAILSFIGSVGKRGIGCNIWYPPSKVLWSQSHPA